MNTLLSHVANFLVKARILLLAIALVITAFFARHAVEIEFNVTPESIFIENDDAYEFYQSTYLPQFSQTGTPCTLAIYSEEPGRDLTPALIVATKMLAKNPNVSQVIAPHTQVIYLPSEEGFSRIPVLDEKSGLTKQAIAYFDEHPLYQGAFLSKSKNAMALAFMLDVGFQDQQNHNEAISRVNATIEELKRSFPDLTFYATGLPIIQNEMIELLQRDQLVFVPLVGLFLIVLLLGMTKHPLGALYPLIVIFLAIIWTVGNLSLSGHNINVVNHAIIILMMVIGIADAVHIYTRFVEESAHHRKWCKKAGERLNKLTVIKNTIAAMLLPCFLTSATTALGFAASSAAGVNIIKQFGTDAAFGVMFCFVVTFMVMPAMLSFHPLPEGHHVSWLTWWPKRYTVDALLRRSITRSIRYARVLSMGAVVLTAVAIFFARGVTSHQTWVGELPKTNVASIALDFIEKNFTGVMPFYVVFSGEESRLLSFDAAKAISTISEQLRSHPLKPVMRSPTDPLTYLLSKNPEPLILPEIDPDTFAELMGAIRQFSDSEFKNAATQFWSKDKTHVRMLGFLHNQSTDRVEQFRDYVDKTLSDNKVEGIVAQVTGPAFISSRALHNITRDMTVSIGLAVLYISLFIAIFFRSMRYTLIAILPNILPIALALAFMHLCNIELRLATVMIFSMALGLAIDTCIHLLCRVVEETAGYRQPIRKFSFMKSIFRAFHGSGRPIIYTTVILFGGFCAMGMSEFIAMRDFSLISALIVVSALVSDIVLLPSMLFLTRKKS